MKSQYFHRRRTAEQQDGDGDGDELDGGFSDITNDGEELFNAILNEPTTSSLSAQQIQGCSSCLP